MFFLLHGIELTSEKYKAIDFMRSIVFRGVIFRLKTVLKKFFKKES